MFKLTIILLAVTTDAKKPYTKRQQAVWRLECNLGVINDVDCPVDGGWGPWSPWSPCQGSCDDVGHNKRSRKCINPIPSKDGLPCSGPDEQTKSCHLSNCSVEDFRKLVLRDATRTESFRQLEAIPALTERCLQMECPFEAIEVSLANDNTWQLTPEAVWNALQCVKHNIGCLVAGEWGNWGAWSACGAQCGKGHRWRLRRCDNPPPSAAHLVCSGCPLEAEDCEGDRCMIDDPLNETIGTWAMWGPWSTCSEKCGTGVRRRIRACNEKHVSDATGTWGTHCRGPHDELETCQNVECIQNGGWSGWSSWGPCSQTCGAGKRSRTRSCTRPVPSGNGNDCMGPRTEAGPCNLVPCEGYTHSVAVLNGESFLHYNFENKRSVLFHFYVRFMSLSPHGTLVRRGAAQNPLVRLSLQKWHVCLDASGLTPTCGLPRICSATVVEPATWHSALISITSEAASLRLDDEQVAIKSTFPCDPELPDEKMHLVVGEHFHGEIQDLILNFIPLNMMIERDRRLQRSDFYPTSVSNIAYQNSNQDEAYLTLDNEQYLRIPCFNNQYEWRLDLTVKPTNDDGTVLFLHDGWINSWLSVALQNCRVRMKLAIGDFRSESSSSDECPFDQWLDVAVSKKKDSNTIEASINSGENLHVSLVEEVTKRRRCSRNFDLFNKAASLKRHTCKGTTPVPLSICGDEFYIGGIPNDIKSILKEDFISFSGIIASLKINGILQDLQNINRERYKDDKLQLSSRSASVSGSYHEVAWGESNHLNLTCLHARAVRSLVPHNALWLFLDTIVHSALKGKTLRSLDDGRVLRLVAKADNDLRGFYTCRAHSNRRTTNIVTYGVLGKLKYKLSGPDTTTAIAVLTTIILVIGTLGWLGIEGLNDLRTGYGFYRDAHLTPQEEAEAVCKYIDDNIDLYSNKSDAKMAKALARRRGWQLESHANFGAQEPQGMNADDNTVEDLSSPETVFPALKETKSPTEQMNDVLKHEQSAISYPSVVSSPLQGSNVVSPRGRAMSCSSLTETSPRFLCSRLFLSRRIYSSKESICSRKSLSGQSNTPRRMVPKLPTIKSSRGINLSPAQKVLLKFQQLKTDDS
ncbi:uncharacterized protein LOC128682928 [Plodia interpunctella]|uniref:uncharacterized protein LOC128682928 n=1 Tax=Plodia interpunctella TaxID=58824 RepID=UPI002368A978|nr:uncharacterized protein LOC128682928 [Plodia interpunctella]